MAEHHEQEAAELRKLLEEKTQKIEDAMKLIHDELLSFGGRLDVEPRQVMQELRNILGG